MCGVRDASLRKREDEERAEDTRTEIECVMPLMVMNMLHHSVMGGREGMTGVCVGCVWGGGGRV